MIYLIIALGLILLIGAGIPLKHQLREKDKE